MRLSAQLDASRSSGCSLILVLLPALTATANGAAAELHIRGPYATPCLTTKGRISFQGSVDSSAVQLRIVWTEPDGGCQTEIDEFSYTAVLTDISAGEYTVEVWYDNTVNRDGPVLDTVLAVSQ